MVSNQKVIETSPDKHLHIKIPALLTDKHQPSPSHLSQYYQNNLFWPDRFSTKVLGF